MRIEFTKSGGLVGLRTYRTFDTKEMSTEQARELTSLVEAANFFELPETARPSGGADSLQYSITIEKDGKSHTVHAEEHAVPPALSPLIKWLTAASRPAR